MRSKTYLTGAFLLLLLILGCNVDHGLAPLPGKLAVTVIFRGEQPKTTQGIYLMVSPVFPPHAINELFQSPNSLPLDQDTVYTEMALPFGHYDAFSLWWYNTETKSNLADILALPLDPFNSLLPRSFDLTPEKPVFETTLYANWNTVNRNAAIEGTIYFNGPFPPNTMATAIAAYSKKPEQSVHYLVWLKSMDFSIDKNPYHFNLPIRHGDVNFLAVFWLPERASLTDFKVLGVYEDPTKPGSPGRIRIKEGEVLKGMDIYADWSVIGEQ